MNTSFYNQIKNSSAHTQNRIDNANFVLQNLNLIPELLNYCFNTHDKQHIRACCVLEKVFEMDLGLCLPYLDFICNHLHLLKNDSAIRSMSRFIMLLSKDNSKKSYLSDFQIKKIIEVNFDWLIADYRVAVKHHAIYTLYEIGKKNSWIHNEIKPILEKDAPSYSIGYKVVVKKILKLI